MDYEERDYFVIGGMDYEEKHAVAKLIGAPAGYVGYEEGGLLTEQIR